MLGSVHPHSSRTLTRYSWTPTGWQIRWTDSRRSQVRQRWIYRPDNSRSRCRHNLPSSGTPAHSRRSYDPTPDQHHSDSSPTASYCTELIIIHAPQPHTENQTQMPTATRVQDDYSHICIFVLYGHMLLLLSPILLSLPTEKTPAVKKSAIYVGLQQKTLCANGSYAYGQQLKKGRKRQGRGVRVKVAIRVRVAALYTEGLLKINSRKKLNVESY